MMNFFLKPSKRFILSIAYMLYDGYRYLRFSGILNRKKIDNLDYKIIKSYHSLEKSLSFKDRKKSAGWVAAERLIELLESEEIKTLQRKTAIKVLQKYRDNAVLDSEKDTRIRLFLEGEKNILQQGQDVKGGVFTYTSQAALRGKLEDPEMFFNSRYSVRCFKKENIDKSIVERALKLASKTPSVCNRQSWGVFHIDNKDIISKALLLQNGNKGFSDEISDLLVVGTNLSSFDSEIERFQCWVDGGIYAMSLVYAFHALGVSSCFLNLSLAPHKDLRLRKLLKSPPEYSFITMIAIGYPLDEFNVCVSSRTPVVDYYYRIN